MEKYFFTQTTTSVSSISLFRPSFAVSTYISRVVATQERGKIRNMPTRWVWHTLSGGPRSIKGFVHRLQFCLKLAEVNLSNIKWAG